MSRIGPLGAASVDDVVGICRFLSTRNTFYAIARDRGFEQEECNRIGLNDTLLSLALPMCWVAVQQSVTKIRIDMDTAFFAAKEVIATIPNAGLNVTIGVWVVDRYDLLTFVKKFRSIHPDVTVSTVQELVLPLADICVQLLMNRFTQTCDHMAEAAKAHCSEEEIRPRTVYGITLNLLQAASRRYEGDAVAQVGTREGYDFISFLPAVAVRFNAACSRMADLNRGILTTDNGGTTLI